MEREVQDAEKTTWKCVQAFAGLGADSVAPEAARTGDGRVRVVCTPSGGARSVTVALPEGWHEKLSDAQLLEALQAAQRDAS